MRLLARILPVVVLAALAAPAIAKEPPTVAATDTVAWITLSRHWRELSQHWAGRVYSKDKLKALNEDLIIATGALPPTDKEFTVEARAAIEELTRQRADFVRRQRYEPTGMVSLSNLDYYISMARTALENDFAMLLWPPPLETVSEETIRANARKDILLQLDFLQRSEAVTALIAKHRAEAEKREADKKLVDWNRFTLEAYRRTQAVIDDYNARKTKPDKTTLRLHKLVLSLIEEPLPTFGDHTDG